VLSLSLAELAEKMTKPDGTETEMETEREAKKINRSPEVASRSCEPYIPDAAAHPEVFAARPQIGGVPGNLALFPTYFLLLVMTDCCIPALAVYLLEIKRKTKTVLESGMRWICSVICCCIICFCMLVAE
jgi:hypothetical protein